MKNFALLLVIPALLGLCGCGSEMGNENPQAKKLSHDVYFTLKDDSPAARQKLIDDCYKYLSNHSGIVYFSAGERIEELDRNVNVKDWQVSLSITFKNKDYHDQYQQAPDHLKFIEENKTNWKTVRVFDSFIR